MAMMKKIIDFFNPWKHSKLLVLLRFLMIFIPLFLAASYVGVEFSSNSRFCTTCHYMKPFYDSWKTSKHSKVECVECHYPPGFTHKLAGKFKASVSLVKYITRQYGTKAYVEIDDSSCLQEGCHSRQKLKGKTKFKDVVFDHSSHLAGFRKVTKLRCTSCHAQIVQRSHIMVTSASCFLCHFKNKPEYENLSKCLQCHKDYLMTAKKETMIDHKKIIDRKVDCYSCHYDIIRSSGIVPKSRCHLCHSEEKRIAKYNDTKFMHKKHVTEHKVDCLQCHTEIQHEMSKREDVVSLDCSKCHPNHHENQKTLFLGAGGYAHESKNQMFRFRVSCTGCHKTMKGKGAQEKVYVADQSECIKCHGKEYKKIFAFWKKKFDLMLSRLDESLKKCEKEADQAEARGKLTAANKKLLNESKHIVEMVKYGHAIHNPAYSEELLVQADKDLNQVMEAIGSSYKTSGFEGIPLTTEYHCNFCHTVDKGEKLKFGNREFKHQPHLDMAGLTCTDCHSKEKDPQGSKHGTLVIDVNKCKECHPEK